jgi:Phage integrase family
MLSPNLLEELRKYWRSLRVKPKTWLFPGNRWHTANHPIDCKVSWNACHEAAQRAGIQKELHPHTLRHYAASGTMPRKSKRDGEVLTGLVLVEYRPVKLRHSSGGFGLKLLEEGEQLVIRLVALRGAFDRIDLGQGLFF